MKNKILTLITILFLLSMNINVNALMKDETVYTKLNYDGSIKSVIVNEYLKNTSKSDTMEDLSNLKDIINVNSNHTFTQNDFNLTWKSLGNDIFYQGKINKNLPVSVNISYEINGVNYKPSSMIGKSGKVKLTLKYQNKDKHVVHINGKKETLYTPFVVTTGLILDSKNNSNVEVINGKVINNGSNYIVAGISAPGMYESFDMEELKGLDEIIITYDTKKFELSSIYSAFTPKIIENSDLEAFDKLGSISSDVQKLTSSMNKIEDGSKILSNGINEAYNGSNTIKTKVSDSIASLKQDHKEVLDEKTLEMIKMSAMSEANLSEEELNAIAYQASQKATLTDEELNQISSLALSSVGTITLSGQQKNDIIANVNNMIEKDYAEEIKSGARNEVDTLLSSIVSKLSFTPQQMIALSENKIDDSVASILANNLNNVLLSNLTSSKEEIYVLAENSAMESAKKIASASAINAATISANQTASVLAPEVSKKVATTLTPKVAGKVSKEVASTLSPEVAGKVAPALAASVASSVKNEATNQIISSMTILNSGLEELTSGLSKLNDGSKELASGISTFNREGISKISSLSNKAEDVTNRVDALIKLGEEYQTFTMKSDSTDGSTKFVMVTESLKEKSKVKKITESKEKTNLWTRIKKLFN